MTDQPYLGGPGDGYAVIKVVGIGGVVEMPSTA